MQSLPKIPQPKRIYKTIQYTNVDEYLILSVLFDVNDNSYTDIELEAIGLNGVVNLTPIFIEFDEKTLDKLAAKIDWYEVYRLG